MYELPVTHPVALSIEDSRHCISKSFTVGCCGFKFLHSLCPGLLGPLGVGRTQREIHVQRAIPLNSPLDLFSLREVKKVLKQD